MKETEFVVSSDKKNWMDASVISDRPFKITIIDPIQYIRGLKDALNQLPCIQDEGFGERAYDHLCRTMILTIFSAVVNRRRAWIYGEDTDVEVHLINLRELIGFDIDAGLRELIRDDLGDPQFRHVADLLDNLLVQSATLLQTHMNPNRFVLHHLTQGRDMRTLMLEEYADWRVIQWTKSEQDKIASRHETI